MEKMFFVIPDVDSAHDAVSDLREHAVDEDQIAMVAKETVPLDDLPEAPLVDQTDAVPGMKRGVAVGGATGLLAGLAATTVPGTGLVLGGGALAGLSALGAAYGAWVSGVVGGSVRNSELQPFVDALNRGKIVMSVEVPPSEAESIQAILRQRHPAVSYAGTAA
jgi:hypothetical protein